MFSSSQEHQVLLASNKLTDFDAFWQLPENWVEPPNQRRGGWSGVSTQQIKLDNGDNQLLYIKRQHAHTFRSFRYPFSKPTAWREYQNNLRLHHLGFPVANCVFYQEQNIQGCHRAVMATLAIADPIDLTQWLAVAKPDQDSTRRVLNNIASDVRRLHDMGFEYRALYGNHILLAEHQTNPSPQHFFIDVETMRRQIPHLSPRVRDICQFFRHTPSLNEVMKTVFLDQYLQDSPDWAVRFRENLHKRMTKKNKAR